MQHKQEPLLLSKQRNVSNKSDQYVICYRERKRGGERERKRERGREREREGRERGGGREKRRDRKKKRERELMDDGLTAELGNFADQDDPS